MSGRRFTVFVEIASNDDPPWEVYRHVTAGTVEQAKLKAVRMVSKDLDMPPDGCEYRATRVFPGHIEEVEE